MHTVLECASSPAGSLLALVDMKGIWVRWKSPPSNVSTIAFTFTMLWLCTIFFSPTGFLHSNLFWTFYGFELVCLHGIIIFEFSVKLKVSDDRHKGHWITVGREWHLNGNSNADHSPSCELNLSSSSGWFVMHVVGRIGQCGEPGARARSW